MKIVGMLALIGLLGSCEVDIRQARTAGTKEEAQDAKVACDKPEVYGLDCTGDHPPDEYIREDRPGKGAEIPDVKEETEGPPAPPSDPNVVTFAIKSGTGDGPWNAKDNMVVTKVGQILRITNNDSTPKQIHTPGSPFAHGKSIAPGETVEYKIDSPLDPGDGEEAPTYNHLVGRGAPFWLRADP
jgi:hypothetical protein